MLGDPGSELCCRWINCRSRHSAAASTQWTEVQFHAGENEIFRAERLPTPNRRDETEKTALPTAIKACSATPHKTPFIVIQGAAHGDGRFIIHN